MHDQICQLARSVNHVLKCTTVASADQNKWMHCKSPSAKACDHLPTSLGMAAAGNSPTNLTSTVRDRSFYPHIRPHSQLPELLKWCPYPYSLHFSSKGLGHEAGCEAVLGRVGRRGVRMVVVVGGWECGSGTGLQKKNIRTTAGSYYQMHEWSLQCNYMHLY